MSPIRPSVGNSGNNSGLGGCKGCIEAMTPSCLKRGMSSGWITSICSMGCRLSRVPFRRCASSKASSVRRTPASPIACTAIWKPNLSAIRQASFIISAVNKGSPLTPGRSA